MVYIGDARGILVTSGKDIKCRQTWGKTALNAQYVYYFRARDLGIYYWYS